MKNNVHAAQLFKSIVAVRVFEDHLFTAVFFTFKLGDHGGSIVTAAFCSASTAFTSASILRGQPNVHRLGGAEVDYQQATQSRDTPRDEQGEPPDMPRSQS